MRTPIYTTKKLEKTIKKIIQTDKNSESGILGKWNATIFYVDRKKCWLISNAKTQYCLILPDVKSADLNLINKKFKDSLYEQLKNDGIYIEFDKLNEIIGEIEFHPTDNDRKTAGFQNHKLANLECWKVDYEKYENMPFIDLASGLNSVPIHIGTSKKMDDFTKSTIEIKRLLTE
ncbi:DUF6933 domain-containing protein [Lutibacter holmesii]|uniref:DUF6933 domain-containing protein n=1 Tax=Lutibacter holmesii TaxID=1137985 RepID=A0ABW3WQ04_9FLAO